MSESTATETKSMSMNPSTYKQVAQNMAQINDLLSKMGDLENLPMSVEEMGNRVQKLTDMVIDPSDTGSLGTTEDGDTKVIGTHANTEYSEEDIPPSSYQQGMTMELKNVDKIGLSGKSDISKQYVFVLTLIQDTKLKDEATVDSNAYTPMQIAYADKSVTQYVRAATSDSAWGEWQALKIDIPTVENQVIVSETEPENQPEGHFWAEPIVSSDTTSASTASDEPEEEEEASVEAESIT
jgi:hypothetical protein